MKLEQLLRRVNVRQWCASPSLDISYFSADSRNMRQNSAFVCLKGKIYDGYQYVPTAMELGAVVVICERAPDQKIPYVLVDDVRSTLPLMLSEYYHHPQEKFSHVIGITGTNGKTTTSYMLRSIFQQAGHKTGLIGTCRYLIGDRQVSLTEREMALTTPEPELLFRLMDEMVREGCDTLIMEVSSHALALKKVEGIPFTTGAFTNLTRDHLDFHGDMENYRDTKKKLFSASRRGVFNQDDPAADALSEGMAEKIFYSRGPKGDYRAEKILSHTPQGIRYRLKTPTGESEVALPMAGEFNINNSLCAIATATGEGIPLKTCLSALEKMEPVTGRIQRIPTNTPYDVFLDFAHTPDALENILKTLRAFTKNRLIVLFGCGGDRDKTKRPMMGEIACRYGDYVIVTSDNCRSEDPQAILSDILKGMASSSVPRTAIVLRREAIRYALSIAQEGDVILLAGKGHEEYEIDQKGKRPFSEKKIVLETIGEKKL